jgi:tetratricopeptide (TPR) repeat protein
LTPGEIGLRIGAGLGWFWWMRGYLSEGRARLEALLRRSGGETASPEAGGSHEVSGLMEDAGGPVEATPAIRLARARVLNAAGMIADEQGDTPAARAFFEESLALSHELNDRLGAARALSNLGGLAVQARDYPAARTLYEESLRINEEIGDPWSTAGALTNLGRLANVQREYAAARALVERALAIQRQLQDRRATARSLTVLGIAAARMGDYEAAQALYVESLSLARELGATTVVVETLRLLGSIARERGDMPAAAAFHEERLALAREVGSVWAVAESLAALGLVARDRGEWGRAGTLWSESLTLFQRQGNPRGVAECLEGLASLAALADPDEPGTGAQRTPLRGVPARTSPSEAGYPRSGPGRWGTHFADAWTAARLLGAAEALREAAGAPIHPRYQGEYEQQVAAVRDRLPAAAFADAWADGRAMTEECAVALALEIGSGSTPPSG